jgi:hypothetical protein
MTILTLIALMTFGVMGYAPLAAVLVEMFPPRIRYTSMSLPYHVGNGWLGGFLPASVFAIVAAKGDMYAVSGIRSSSPPYHSWSQRFSGRDERCRHQSKRLVVTVSLYVVRYQEGKDHAIHPM